MKKQTGRSLLWRIALTNIVVQCIVALALVFYIADVVRNFNRDELQANLQRIAAIMASELSVVDGRPQFAEAIGNMARTNDIRVTLIAEDGLVLQDNERPAEEMDNHADRPEVRQALAEGTGRARRYSQTLQTDLIYTAIRLSPPDSETLVLRLSRQLSSAVSAEQPIVTAIAIALGIAVLITLLTLIMLSRSISQRMLTAVNTAEGFAAGDFARRLTEDGPSEFTGLARALNGMAENLDRSISALQSQTTETLAILQSMSDALIAIDAEQRILRLNTAALEMFELSDVDIRGRLLQEVILEPEVHRAATVALKHGTRHVQEIHFSKGTRLAEIVAEPLLDGQGKLFGTILALEEVTRLRQLERIRSDFAANVSHELRTPITSISGYAEMLQETEDPAITRKCSKVIVRNVQRLSAIIEDLLALARLEDPHRRNSLEIQLVRVRPVVDAVVAATRESSESKNTSIDIDVDEHFEVRGTRPLLEQAISNLLTNAIKYGDANGRVKIHARPAPGDMLRIDVEDSGPGIAHEHLDRIFERFYRVDGGRSRELGGTGLGLAIVKHIASVLGGTIEVQSQAGIGSTFSITLPAK